jgi:peptide/nickel transport system substrate-binding protein
MISEDLEDVGIVINIVPPETLKGETMDQAFLRMLQNGDYKIALVGFSVSAVPEFSSLLNAVGWIDNNVDQTEGFGSYFDSSYSSWDETAKFDNFSRLQRAFADDIPVGSLFFLNRSLMVDNQIAGPLEPNFYNLYNGLEKCFLTFSTD